MRVIGVIIVFICTMIFAIVGGLLVAFSLNLLTVQDFTAFLSQTFQIQNIHLLIGGTYSVEILPSKLILRVFNRKWRFAFSSLWFIISNNSFSFSTIRSFRNELVPPQNIIGHPLLFVKVSIT